MWAEKWFDEHGSSLSLCSQIMVAKASGDTNGGEQPGPLPLPINHRELEIRLLDDLVGPPSHMGVSVQHSAANVSSERIDRDYKRRSEYLSAMYLVGRLTYSSQVYSAPSS